MVKEYRMSKARLTFLNNSKQPYPAWSMSLLKDAVEINPKTESLPNQFVYIDLEAVQRGTLISTKGSSSKPPSLNDGGSRFV